MAKKENRGGILKNEDVEKELELRGDAGTNNHPYKGSQDTGDDKPSIKETGHQQEGGTDDKEKV